jgi:hypothetical protein
MLTEDQKPFFLATYIAPKSRDSNEGFETLLQKYGKKYRDKNEQIKEVTQTMLRMQESNQTQNFGDITTQTLRQSIINEFDDFNFGFSNAPKFPEVAKLQLMFLLSNFEKSEIQNNAYEMLDMMAYRGLYDQVEGGFFRYCVDASWEIPHFEKMLYNQAQLSSLYTDAYAKTGKKLYKDIVEETLAFVEKRFQKDGVFWSASDADSMEEEGGYFTFTKSEVEQAIKKSAYKSSFSKNFDGKIHINLYANERGENFEKFRHELQKIRETKIYPFIDKKINTAWSAMMIEAYFKASVIDEKYLQQGEYYLQKLLHVSYSNKKLYHLKVVKNVPKKPALLEDYSFLISALIEGYEQSYDERKLKLATKLCDEAIAKFYQNGTWILSEKALHHTLHVRAEIQNKHYTSALGKMMQNLLYLSILDESLEYKKIADKSLKILHNELVLKQSDAPSLSTAYLMDKIGVIGIKHTKTMLLKNKKEIQKVNYPFIVTKAESDANSFSACSFTSCFSSSKDLFLVGKDIENLLILTK